MLSVNDILNESHILIGGCTGCGKSTLTNRMLFELVHRMPSESQLILIDNKGTEYKPYKLFSNCLQYATTPVEACMCFAWILEEIERRSISIQDDIFAREYKGAHIYILIDELADLLSNVEIKRRALPLLQRIAQIGRAFRIHLIVCTQDATKQTIGTIKNNITCQIALRCSSRQESKNIIGFNGAENISKFGVALCKYKGQLIKLNFEPVKDSEVLELLQLYKLI